MISKFRAVSLDELSWTAQIYVDYVSSSGQPVGWIDIKASPRFKFPHDAICWAKNVWY